MLEGKPLFPGKDRARRLLPDRPPLTRSQTSTSSRSSRSCWARRQTMSSRPSAARTSVGVARPLPGCTDTSAQTLRFVQSLPKRERIPFSQKFRNADPAGPSRLFLDFAPAADPRRSHRPDGEDAGVRPQDAYHGGAGPCARCVPFTFPLRPLTLDSRVLGALP
jgi:hypothetical protein